MGFWRATVSVARDIGAWLALWGLVHLATPGMARWLAPTPRPVCRLLALIPVSLTAYAATAGGLLPPQPMHGPIEAMGTAGPLGGLGWLLGGAGWGVWAWGSRRAPRVARIALGPRVVAALPLLAAPYTLLPPWAIDESSYHVALPMHARVLGALQAPLGHGNGGFYALAEWVGAWGLAMGSLSAARGVQILGVVLGAHAALSVLAPPAQRRWALAWAVFLASPAVLWQLPTSYVDVLLASFVGVAALCTARLQRAAPGDGKGAARACGLLVGAAIAIKPTAGVLLPVFAVSLGRMPGTTHRRAAMAVRWALWVPLPFAVMDLCHYHTPLFPFIAPLWSSTNDLLPAQHEVLAHFFAQHGPTFNGAPADGIWRWLLLPWGLFWQARFASPCFDGVLGGAPLVIMAWAIGCGHPAAGARSPDKRAMPQLAMAWAAVLVAAWLATSWQARFLLPPLYLVLLAWAATVTPGGLPGRRRGWAVAAFAAQVATWPLLQGHLPPLAWTTLGTDASRAAHRRAGIAASSLCEGAAMADARVMLVWSQRLLLYCPQAMVADSYDEGARLDAWLAADDGAAQAARALQHAGITHLIVHEALWLALDPRLPAAERARAQQIAEQWNVLKRDWLQPQARVGAIMRFQCRATPRA